MATHLIKLGGAILEAPEALGHVWAAIRALSAKHRVIVVHGGGPQATGLARRLGHEPRIVHGRRVTGELDLAIIQWTIRGELNTRLVAAASAAGLDAVGLSGVDGGLLRVTRRPPRDVGGETVDFGWVGDVERVNPRLLDRLLEEGFLPVLAPLGADSAGQVYNVNADTVALAVARATGAVRLYLATESGGVRRAVDDPASHVSRLDAATYRAGLEDGWISGGMRAKLEVAFDAARAGIPEVYILAPEELLRPEKGTRVV